MPSEHAHPVNQAHHEFRRFGERLADRLAATVGSWRFILGQTFIQSLWMAWNVFSPLKFDPPPFILLNLLLSTEAGYTGAVLQLASNRASAKDRDTLEHDYATTQAVLAALQENTRLTLAIVQHLGLSVDQLLESHAPHPQP